MSAVRFQIRHAQQTLADHLKARLTALGWTEEPVNFGISPVELVEVEPEETERLPDNAVGVAFTYEGPDVARELGGGLWAVEYELRINVKAVSGGIARSIASDVKDVLGGLVLTLQDYTKTPPTPVEGAYLEVDDVAVLRPTAGERGFEWKRNWRIVDGLVTCIWS